MKLEDGQNFQKIWLKINVSDNSDKVLHYNGPDAVDLDFDFARMCNNWSSAKTAFQGLEDCFLVHRERPC